MAAESVGGVLPVLAVPFHDDGALDLPGFEAVCHHVLGTGADGALLFGLASEFYKLSDAERLDLRRCFLTVARGYPGTTAIVSVTAHATHLAVAEARAAVADGATAINLLPPHFLAPSPTSLRVHLAAVLSSVEVPIIVQYAPAQTGTSFASDALRSLARDHANLTTVKVESQPPGRFVGELAAGDPPLAGIVGYAGLQLPDAVGRGAVGVQPGCSFTELYVDLWRHHLAGRRGEFEDLHRRMLPYLSTWMQGVEFIIQVEKTILHRRGLIASDHCRQPAWRLDAQDLVTIDRFLAEFADRLGSPTTDKAR